MLIWWGQKIFPKIISSQKCKNGREGSIPQVFLQHFNNFKGRHTISWGKLIMFYFQYSINKANPLNYHWDKSVDMQ